MRWVPVPEVPGPGSEARPIQVTQTAVEAEVHKPGQNRIQMDSLHMVRFEPDANLLVTV